MFSGDKFVHAVHILEMGISWHVNDLKWSKIMAILSISAVFRAKLTNLHKNLSISQTNKQKIHYKSWHSVAKLPFLKF